MTPDLTSPDYAKWISDNLTRVRARIAAGCDAANRPQDSVNLLAVSKTKPISAVQAAMAAGQVHFGENYLQDALDKITVIPEGPIWHFIGAIQSNKTRAIAENFHWVHTVSSIKIATRLHKQRPDHLPPLKVFFQVNVDNDPAKAGVTPEQLPELVAASQELDRLEIVGLMTLPAQTSSLSEQRKPFHALRQLQMQYLPNANGLSMGMSGDLEAAIFEQATWVRIGTDIFGARQAR